MTFFTADMSAFVIFSVRRISLPLAGETVCFRAVETVVMKKIIARLSPRSFCLAKLTWAATLEMRSAKIATRSFRSEEGAALTP